jgi:small subunit ribosomal protein S18
MSRMPRENREPRENRDSRESRDSRYAAAGQNAPQGKLTKTSGKGVDYVDWKDVETLRRALTPNGKIHGRKKLDATAAEQRMLGQALKRARHMGLLPFTNATL